MDINQRNQLFRKALNAYRQGGLRASASDFRRLIDDGSNDPRHISYYGLLTALADGRMVEGRKLCEKAVKEAFYDPEMYLNLAKVYFRAGQKTRASQVLRKGMRVDPDDHALRRELARINPRATPALDFLHRGHPLNKYFGLTRSRLSRLLGRNTAYLM
jgi:predicted Zn-dependent protease